MSNLGNSGPGRPPGPPQGDMSGSPEVRRWRARLGKELHAAVVRKRLLAALLGLLAALLLGLIVYFLWVFSYARIAALEIKRSLAEPAWAQISYRPVS
ncbi:MAG: hypothetical protein ABSG68_03285, partial [Thermoguttaceae bacterium]